ncbi:N-terminal kinase-like protein isoform X2 [Xenia sp. Carnegie-2017]|uniref:N-terminal kinase-like protein isoform X2 n=1 Tax=Xenia sp. Carnegie-2017 TaxID=2897299 RepID=UPI001F03CA36|nr:N-terminal kinase-like protein isoform X2 [Xenia sp. Carnegie-2017]
MHGLWNLIGKVGQSSTQAFPYEIGDKIVDHEGRTIWTLHSGKKKGTEENVSIFAFDVKNSSSNEHEVAKAEFKRLKTLRHPTVLRFIDGLESESFVYIVTEAVIPLEKYLKENTNELEISWGIHQIATALDFLISNAGLVHGNICLSSIFVDSGGEWKLGGVAYIHPSSPSSGGDVQTFSRFPWMQKYDPPEGVDGAKLKKKTEKWSADVWGLGCLIWEIFNGPLPKSSSLKSVGKIPSNLLSHYGELVSANPKSRPDPAKFIAQCRAKGQYLANTFVDSNLFLAEIQIKTQDEQKEFFKSLSSQLDAFPQKYCKLKILPLLLNAFEYGSAGSTVLTPLFKIGKLLDAEDYQQKIVPCVVKLFSSTDRATRIQLLQQLNNFVEHLQGSVINNQIFPNVATGFNDTVPAVREHTVKSMLLLVPKLNEKTINNQLLKFFAKLQLDEQPSIRTNTTVCLGKIACHLPETTRAKVIVAAFLRALRDPFPPARMAGINALCVTLDFIPIDECAKKVLPTLCTMTIDSNKSVRDQCFKAIRLILSKLENHSEDLNAKDNTCGSSSSAGGSDPTSGSWTGWAMSSLSRKFYRENASAVTSDNKEDGVREKTKKSPANTAENVNVSKSHDMYEKKSNCDDEGSDNESQENEWEIEEDTVSSIKKDFIEAKSQLTSFMSGKGRKESDMINNGGDSDSDYGEENNWNSFSLSSKQKKSTANFEKNSGPLKLTVGNKKSAVSEDDILSELMSDTTSQAKFVNLSSSNDDNWNDVKDSFVQDDNWTQSFFVKSGDNVKTTDKFPKMSKKVSSRVHDIKAEKPKPKTSVEEESRNSVDFDGWDAEDWAPLNDLPLAADKEENWETEGWESFASFDENKASDLAKKKREERRKQREKVLKEKRAARGTLKLGATKKD